MSFRSELAPSGKQTMTGRLHVPLAAALLLGAAGAAAQTTAPPASVVDFLVLDKDDRPVSGLTAADIELTENGEQRTFTDFRAVGPAAANSEPRRFVIAINRRGAEARRLRRARAALRQFASDRLSEDDEAMLVEIGATVRILQEFATGGDALRASLDDLSFVPHEVFEGPRHADGGGIWDLLGSIGSALGRLPGRKVVILMSADQSTYPSSSPASSAWTFDQQSFLDAQLVFNAAKAVVYFVDLAGDARNRFDPSFGGRRQEDPFATFDWYSARGSRPQVDQFEGGLGALAKASGGAYYRNPVGFRRVLARIDRQNQLWYQLAWSSPGGRSEDRQARPLAIRVRGRDEVKVVARPVLFPRRVVAGRFQP